MIEQTAEIDRMNSNQALLVTGRTLFLENLVNVTNHSLDHLDIILLEYEKAVSQAASVGVNVVTQDFVINWSYLQSVFFAMTMLTTIGIQQSFKHSIISSHYIYFEDMVI